MKRYTRETSKDGVYVKLKPESQRMRLNPTSAEKKLWDHLRNKKLGFRFRRQHQIDRFIVDFVCLTAFLVVEVDGGVHQSQMERDAKRDEIILSMGFRLIRFSNQEVLENIDSVLAVIQQALPGPNQSDEHLG